MMPMIVGLNNPHSPKPSHALLHYPRGATGWRLLEMMRGVDARFTADDYLDSFERRNLWPGLDLPKGRGSMNLYRRHGDALLREISREPGREVILLGLRVWYSVLGRNEPEHFDCQLRDGTLFHYLPHPSGLCRVYNDPAARIRAGKILLNAAAQRKLRIVRAS